jgi:hypothetical protein
VYSQAYNSTAGYNLSLQSLTGGGCNSSNISCGETLSAGTGFNSETDAYAYAGTAGQLLSLSFYWSDINQFGEADIYNPSGQLVTNVSARDGGSAVGFSLPASGTYTILVYSDRRGVQWRFHFLRRNRQWSNQPGQPNDCL